MASYPIPQWLDPSAAQGYGALAGEAQRAAMSDQLQRERLSQSATQFAIEAQQRSQQTAAEMQARQEQLNQEHQMEQQKIAIDQAYKQQQVGLQTADLDLSQKQFQAKTQQVADMHAATQRAQKAMMPQDQGGEGLPATQAYLREVAPYMTGTEIGRLAAADKAPATLRPPQDVPGLPGRKAVETSPGHFQIIALPPDIMTNAPPALPITDENGDVIGHYAINPATHKAELIRPPAEGSGSGAVNKLVENEKKKRVVSTTVDTKKAQGGYKIGVVYKGGMRYLGGDPKDESSWEKVKQ